MLKLFRKLFGVWTLNDVLEEVAKQTRSMEKANRDSKGRFTKGYHNGVKMERDSRGRYVKKAK